MAAVLVSQLAGGCSGGQATAPAPASQRPARTPAASAAESGWQTVAPGSAGLSAARLRQIADQARQGESNCLVVLRNATGQDVAALAEQHLFGPAGMTSTTMTRDGAGNPQTFEGVQSNCRDMARFGQVMLEQGRWGNTRIVSAAWVRQSTGPSSTKLNAAYGYLWWLNHRGVQAGPLASVTLSRAQSPKTPKRRLVPGAPDDLYWAIGLGNQIVQVDPSTQTIVVRLGVPRVAPAPPTFGPAEASEVVTQAVVG